jgi:hypothetical protein
MSRRRRIIRLLWGAAIMFAALQFFRPARNLSPAAPGPGDFFAQYAVPEPFRRQLHASCYDCHSNHTRYPWYTNVQPLGWWLQSHVNDGKAHLNLSEFGRYSPGRRADKIDAMIDELTFRTMPLKSYSLIHGDARLTKAESYALADWLQQLRDTMGEN